jgi:membrane-bound lytic murein transglycosylase D
VAALFGTDADAAVYRAAGQRVRSQLGQSDRFKAGLIRSGAYLEEMRVILRSYGVPEDLAYLPHVESSFNPDAYSKFGAAGMWQFTRSTGRRFMTVDYVMDERRDPIRATHAAAQLLAENYARLGSWPLAITAYNHGAAGMARAQQKHGDYPAVYMHYRSRTFKFASRNFYAEFLAARDVATHYEDHFGPLTLATPTPNHTVVLEGFAHIEDLSNHFGIAPELLRRMNLALRPPVFNGQKYVPKGYRLRLPANGKTLAAIPASLYKDKQKPSRFYTVQRGDTAGRIARAHGVRLSDLILANNLSARATIYPNQTLRIPLEGETITAAAKPSPPPPAAAPPVAVAAVTPTEEAASATSEAIVVVPPAISPTPEAATAEERPAKPSAAPQETLVAKAEETTARTVSSETTRASATVALQKSRPSPAPSTPVGLEAKAPPEGPATATGEVPEAPRAPAAPSDEEPPPDGRAASAAETIGPTPPAATSSASRPQEAPPASPTVVPTTEIVSIDVRFGRLMEIENQPVGILRVEVEETLGHYAEWAGVRTQKIRRLNGLPYGRTLHLHQQVKIPLDRITAAVFEEQRYEYHKRLQEDFFAVYRIAELEPYRVQPGDNIWTLSRETFAVPLWLIKHYNLEADLAALRVEQKLMVPVVAETAAGDPGTVTPEEDAADSLVDPPEASPPTTSEE